MTVNREWQACPFIAPFKWVVVLLLYVDLGRSQIPPQMQFIAKTAYSIFPLPYIE